MFSDIKKKFVALILTHKRPDNVKTVQSLRDHGYTGEIRLVVDDEDPTLPQYLEKYGDLVWIFSKKAIKSEFDAFDNFGKQGTITFPRNAAFELAKQHGFELLIQLDDDYSGFAWKFDSKLKFKYTPIGNLDGLFYAMSKFLLSTPTLSMAMAQGGEYMGGEFGQMGKAIWFKRKAMNSFLCSTSKKFTFNGVFNEDVNTFIGLGNIGSLFFTTNLACLTQGMTQQTPGGITELYLEFGTYTKSFYTVMIRPSCVSIALMGTANRRLHHRINWKYAVPKILPESLRKL